MGIWDEKDWAWRAGKMEGKGGRVVGWCEMKRPTFVSVSVIYDYFEETGIRGLTIRTRSIWCGIKGSLLRDGNISWMDWRRDGRSEEDDI